MSIMQIASALSSETRLKLIRIISNNQLSAVEAFKIYNKTYNEKKHRETIYRELESLVKSNILNKSYLKNKKKIVYELVSEKIIFDLLKNQIEFKKR